MYSNQARLILHLPFPTFDVTPPHDTCQDTLRRLSQALQKTDLEELALKSQAELGINLEGLDFGTAETIGEKAEVSASILHVEK